MDAGGGVGPEGTGVVPVGVSEALSITPTHVEVLRVVVGHVPQAPGGPSVIPTRPVG